MDNQIKALHRVAEFQKKLAWANYNCAQNSTMFKKELLECAKVAAKNCRETRQLICDMINGTTDVDMSLTWTELGEPKNDWD